MQDWTTGQLRYLVHFDDGGSGMRSRNEPLKPGDALFDGGADYVVERVEPAPNPMSFGRLGAGRRAVMVEARRRGPHRGPHPIARTACIAHLAWLNDAASALCLGGEWAGQGSNLRPWD
jgi:hypothetical protein